MGVLADEYVRVRADTSYIARDIKKQGAQSGKSLGQGMLGGLKSIAGPVAGILAGMGVLKFLEGASEAARESWKIGRQTQAVLKSTGGAAKVTQQDIEKLTAAISAKTGIDDEAIQSGANMLLTFTNIRNEVGKGNDVFNQANTVLHDFAVGSVQDTRSASIQLGKALNDPIKGVTALSRVGVNFTEQQKEQIKTLVKSGDTLGAQKIILGELRKEFGGSAEAQATWADKTRVAWDNVKETIGGFLNESLEPVARWFVEEGIPAVQDFFETLSTDPALKQAVQNLKDALAALTGDQDFKASLDGIARALPPIVQGLADVVTKYGEISAAVDKFENMSFAEGDKTGGPVGQIVKDFGAGGTIETALIEFRGFIGTHVKQGWTDAKASFTENHAAIVADLDRFWEKVKSAWTTATTWLKTTWTAFWTAVKTKASAVWEAVRAALAAGWAKVKALWTSASTAVKTTWTAFWTAVKTKAVAVWESVRAYIAGVWAKVKALWTSATTAVKTTWNTFWTNIKSAASTALEWVRSKVVTVLDKIKNAFSTAKTNIKKIWDGLKDVVSKPVEWIKTNVYNKPLVPVWNKVAKLVNGPTLSAYREGGEIRGPRHGRDNVLGISRSGGATAMVEPGEWIAPRWMSSLFPQLESIRKRGRAALQDVGDPKRLPGFQGGGLVGWAKGLASNVSSKVGSLKDWALGGLRAAAAKILDPVKGLIGKAMPNSGVGSTVGNIGKKLIDLILDKIKSSDAAAMPALGGPAGSAIASGGWASIYRVLRAAGARSFTTYAGHDQGASRSRDIWPPSQAVAEAARRLSSIWYVIYNRRIASVTYGMRWRPYTRSNPHTDHVHVTLKPGVKAAMGGMAPMGAGLMNGGLIKGGRGGVLAHIGEGRRDELVTPLPRNWQRQAATTTTDSKRPITILIDLGEGLVQRVQGLIDENDEFRATVGRAR